MQLNPKLCHYQLHQLIQGFLKEFYYPLKIFIIRCFSETITEERVRNLLLKKQYMTSKELIQNFLPRSENLRTKEVKEGIVQKLATILKRLNIEEKTMNGKKYMKLKTT